MLLSIDTSAGTSAAVFAGGDSSFISFDDPFGHAENVGTAITQALIEVKATAQDLTAIAVGRGPAPYTGLRVGMAAATSLAKALGIPLYGVMTLDAIAHDHGTGSLLVVTDAKRRELFAATYVNGVRTSGPMLITAAELAGFSEFKVIQASCDAKKIGALALSALRDGIDISDVTPIYLRSPDVTFSPGKKVSG